MSDKVLNILFGVSLVVALVSGLFGFYLLSGGLIKAVFLGWLAAPLKVVCLVSGSLTAVLGYFKGRRVFGSKN